MSSIAIGYIKLRLHVQPLEQLRVYHSMSSRQNNVAVSITLHCPHTVFRSGVAHTPQPPYHANDIIGRLQLTFPSLFSSLLLCSSAIIPVPDEEREDDGEEESSLTCSSDDSSSGRILTDSSCSME